MRQPLVSIIIPVYNGAKFLSKCIKSLINQTYKNIEILLIDDGSKDNSLKICYQYQEKDKRIRVIHQENSGLSFTRNVGMELASGKYVTFIDCDDYVSKNFIEQIAKKANETDADCVISAMVDVYYLRNITNSFGNNIFVRGDKENLAKLLKDDKLFGFACGKLFRMDIIRKQKLLFQRDVLRCEDCLFVLEYYQYCEKIASIDNAYYFYSHVISGSIVSKIYPLEYSYREKTLQEYKNFVFTFCKDEIFARTLVFNYALYLFYNLTENYGNFDKNELIKNINILYETYSPWINQYKEDNIKSSVHCQRYEHCQKYINGEINETFFLNAFNQRQVNRIKIKLVQILRKIKYIWLYHIFK